MNLNNLVNWEYFLFKKPVEVVRPNYHEYIRSDAWRAKSEAAKERAWNACQVCFSSGPLDTHHRTYERLGNELDEDLIVLCRECHSLFHRHGRLKTWRDDTPEKTSKRIYQHVCNQCGVGFEDEDKESYLCWGCLLPQMKKEHDESRASREAKGMTLCKGKNSMGWKCGNRIKNGEEFCHLHG